MRILIIADPVIAVPPLHYGGAERTIAYLCKGLQKAGHTVDLLAGPGSQNYGGRLIVHRAPSSSLASRGLRKLWFQYLTAKALSGVDIVINFGRLDYLHWILRDLSKPLICCFQNPVTQDEIGWLIQRRRKNLALVGVSHSQIDGIQPTGLFTVIHNVADTELLPFNETPAQEPYLAFLGRLTHNKGVDTAVAVAKRSGIKLKIAGNVSGEPGDKEFFENCIQPQLGPGIEYVGPVNDSQKQKFLGQARALLFPIRWKEPCALTVMESFSCGTPVIATRCASTPEVVQDGVTGFLAESEDELVEAVKKLDSLDRKDCRKTAETKFSAQVMTERYIQVMHRLLGKFNEIQ